MSKPETSAAATPITPATPAATDDELLARRMELLAVSSASNAAATSAHAAQQPPTQGGEPDADADGDGDELPADAEAAVRKTLVLIDFNEFLAFRDKKRHVSAAAAKPDFRAGRSPNKFNFFVRPGAMEFVAQLAQDPRCEFAIYTSMKRANMFEFAIAFDEFQEARGSEAMRPVPCGATGVTTTTSSSLAHGGLAIFDRPFNAPDRSPGKDEWDTVRDLSLIFDFSKVRERGYTAANTVLIEAEAHKIGKWAPNSVQPAAFTAATINSGGAANGGGDTELFRLGESLQAVFTAMQVPGAEIPRVLAAKVYPAFAPATTAST